MLYYTDFFKKIEVIWDVDVKVEIEETRIANFETTNMFSRGSESRTLTYSVILSLGSDVKYLLQMRRLQKRMSIIEKILSKKVGCVIGVR